MVGCLGFGVVSGGCRSLSVAVLKGGGGSGAMKRGMGVGGGGVLTVFGRGWALRVCLSQGELRLVVVEVFGFGEAQADGLLFHVFQVFQPGGFGGFDGFLFADFVTFFRLFDFFEVRVFG